LVAKIDFIIPCHPKDYSTLDLCIDGIQKYTNVKNIYVISPQVFHSLHHHDIRHMNDLEYKDHTTYNQIKNRFDKENPKNAYRAGWLFQQTLKLFSHRVIEDLTEAYAVVDADVIFVRPIIFSIDMFQYCIGPQYHVPYSEMYLRLMKEVPLARFSFISHHMVFNEKIMDEIINYIEDIHNQSFMNVFLDCINFQETSGFSEWNLYGNFVFKNYRDYAVHRQLFWEDIDIIPNAYQLHTYGKFLDFVCPHAWLRGRVK